MFRRIHPAFAAALCVPAAAAACTLLRPPSVEGDFAASMAAWDVFRRGGPFNSLSLPIAADLARDRFVFLGWWSPGPAALAGLLEAMGTTLGASLRWWLLCAGTAAIAGVWRLAIALGFDGRVAAWTALVFSLGWHELYPFRIFSGGELFLGAVAPWVAIAGLQPAATRPSAVLWLAALVVAGTCLKLSFLVLAPGLLAGAWLFHQGGAPRFGRPAILLAARFGAALALAWGILHAILLGRGDTPASVASGWAAGRLAHSAALAFVLPWFSVFSLVSMSGNALDRLGWAHIEQNTSFLALAAAGAAGAWILLARTVRERRYLGFAFGLGATHLAIFTWLYTRGAAVDFSDRHFRPVGIVLLPAVVRFAITERTALLRWGVRAALAAAAAWGTLSYGRYLSQTGRIQGTSERGFTHVNLPEATRRLLLRIDARLPVSDQALFAVPAYDAALEIPRRRSFLYRPDLAAGAAGAAGTAASAVASWRGGVEDIVVVVPGVVNSSEADAALAPFREYRRGDWRRLSSGPWTVFHQGRTDLRGLAFSSDAR